MTARAVDGGVTTAGQVATDLEIRRTTGVVYTPPQLARLLLDRLLGDRGVDGPLLDPACGEGVFLVEAVSRIAAQLRRNGADPAGRDRPFFLHTVEERLWGVDVDGTALASARRRVVAAVNEISPGAVPDGFFEQNLVHGDFLDEDILKNLPHPPRYVIGNPPYVSTATQTPSTRRSLRDRFSFAMGRVDLYVLFMFRCSQVLDEHGRWCLITPDKYLSSIYGAPLREFLSGSGRVVEVLLFSSHRVFAEAATVPCITVWEKQPGSAPTAVHDVRRSTVPGAGWQLASASTVRTVALDGRSWRLGRSAGKADLTDRIVGDRPTLAHVTSRISAGVATGLNAAFLVGDDSPVEHELLHPTVRGRDVQANSIQPSSRRILIPYTWDETGRATLIDLDRFPAAADWLGRFRDALNSRHCVRAWGKQWWDLHDPITLPLHRHSKILVPDIARTNRFAADDGAIFPQNTAYYILPTVMSPRILALLLNSRPIEYLVKTSAPLMKDGFYRYRQQFLRDLPVPRIDRTHELDLLETLDRGAHEELAERMAELYDVDADAVDAALAELDASWRDAP